MLSNGNSSIGLMYPLFATENGSQNVSRTTLDSIKTDIISLLKTRPGERIMQPTLGIALDNYIFEPNVDSIIDNIETDIINAINFWLPFVSVSNISIKSTNEDKDMNRFFDKVTFTVNSLPNKLESIEKFL